jgi:hypothetical protein
MYTRNTWMYRSNAFNYNSLANVDDNSCIAVVLGCTDPTADNYDPVGSKYR